MSFVFYNPNPDNKLSGDCVIRAISKITGQDWEETYVGVCLQGFSMHEMPSTNHVWSSYLKRKGYTRTYITDTCPDCYSVKDFCRDNPKGKFILAIGNHVVAVEDGNYFDTWDSGDELPIYFWRKE